MSAPCATRRSRDHGGIVKPSELPLSLPPRQFLRFSNPPKKQAHSVNRRDRKKKKNLARKGRKKKKKKMAESNVLKVACLQDAATTCGHPSSHH